MPNSRKPPTMLALPKLKPGDKVAILSPSFAAPAVWPHIHEFGLQRLRDHFNLEPVEYPTTRKRNARQEERAKDLIAAFQDPKSRPSSPPSAETTKSPTSATCQPPPSPKTPSLSSATAITPTSLTTSGSPASPASTEAAYSSSTPEPNPTPSPSTTSPKPSSKPPKQNSNRAPPASRST